MQILTIANKDIKNSVNIEELIVYQYLKDLGIHKFRKFDIFYILNL